MKAFLMKFNDDGKMDFIDEKERAAFQRLISLIKRQNSKSNMRMSIELLDPDSKVISNKQINLFKVLVKLISDETGQDLDSVEHTLITNYFGETIMNLESLTTKKFSEFFEFSLAFSQSFFGLNVTYNEKTSNLEILN